MSLRLSFFNSEGQEDVLLPEINNADFTARLSYRRFGLVGTGGLELEVVDHQWSFKRQKGCLITKGGEDWTGRPLSGDDILSIAVGKVSLSLFVQSLRQELGGYVKISTAGLGDIFAGKDPSCEINYEGPIADIISRRHLRLHVSPRDAFVEDLSVNGVYRNGARLRGREKLQFGDVISAFGLRIIYLGDVIAVNVAEIGGRLSQRLEGMCLPPLEYCQPRAADHIELESERLFHRAPRKIPALHTEEEEIEGPPQRREGNRKPAWMVIGPAFTMAVPMLLGCGFMIFARTLTGTGSSLFMYVGLVTAIASAIIGVTWALINLRYSVDQEKEAELLRQQKYGEYLMEYAERIRRKYEYNTKVLREMYPSAEECCSYWKNSQVLWTRNRSHEDFLSCRLGVGDIPFQVPIVVPKKRFSLIQDPLANRPAEIKQGYSMLRQVPINVDLYRHRVIGLIGAGRNNLARLLLTQIAANYCYTDVRLVVLSCGNGGDWSFAKWLPHVWNEEYTRRYVALERSEISGVCYELAQFLRVRSEDLAGTSGNRAVLPVQYVVLVEEWASLEAEPVAKYLLEQPEQLGVTTLLMADSQENLPNSCSYILESSQSFSGMYSMIPSEEQTQRVTFDQISERSVMQLARKITGVRVVTTGAGRDLPDTLTYFDMLGVQSLDQLNVLNNWLKNRTYQTMQAMVGWKAGNQQCYLNIHEKYHGPHGLIAGTTGSGKSETLQTYILSMAVNYSPQDVGFFLIDFKGGGMANLFSGLPHLLGVISNLSGNQIRRAMVSIKSEITRRQRIFNEQGVNHIDAYTKLVKNSEVSEPVPHLIIIIDEFAELKREEPEFMRELISVAQVGRSLGVHLLLATQKPSGTVDDNIWSNTKFRLCLRVADQQDSKDMLHKPDAAFLSQAGRGYLQVGNDEIYEQFQSGWSGAAYDEDMGTSVNSCALQIENDGKVVRFGELARVRKRRAQRRQWVETLVQCCQKAAALTREGNPTAEAVLEQLQLCGARSVDGNDLHELEVFLAVHCQDFRLEKEQCVQKILASAEAGEKLPQPKERTQLDAVVDYLGRVAREHGFENRLRLWMPVLPERLTLAQLQSAREDGIGLRATVGLMDDPQNQAQFPLTVDFLQDGHLAVCGSISSGKSTLLQTIIYSLCQRYTPDRLSIYGIDYSSQMLAPFQDLPHTGGLVYEGEEERLGKLFMLMSRLVEQRKVKLRGGSFLQYLRANGNAEPAILLVIDGYANFREKTENAYEDQLLGIARDGAGLGIFLCVSAGGFGSGEIQAKLGDKFRQVLCLEMDSKYSYGECLRTMRFDVLPEAGIRGRGLAQYGESVLEYQTALAEEGDDYQRGEMIRLRCRKLASEWKGEVAQPIPEIPANPTWELFAGTELYREMIATDHCLPLAYRQRDASIYWVDLSQTYCYLISGREKSGKSTFLRNVACAARDRGGQVYLVDRIGGDTERRTSELTGAEMVNTPEGLFELWKTLILLINQRHVTQQKLVEQGLEDREIFQGMSGERQVFVLIADLPDFIQACAYPSDGRPSMAAQVENILKKGAMHQVYFFAALDTQSLATVSAQAIYRCFTRDKQGIHLGGELNSQKLLSYRNIPFFEQGKALKPGNGHVCSEDDSVNVDAVVIPQNRGRILGRAES